VILTEQTNGLDGQLTAQAVPPDEHPWIKQYGGRTSLPVFARITVFPNFTHQFRVRCRNYPQRAVWLDNLDTGQKVS
jgi:hypothetical protein